MNLALLGIANAYAAEGTTGGSQGFLSTLPLFIILIAFMYFLVIRPQSKRAKEHRNLISNLKAGDEVITSGGILGRIVKLSDAFITISIADNVEIKVQKNAVALAVPKGTASAS